MLRCLCAVVLGVSFLSASAVADDKSDDAKKLEGTWTVVSSTLDGKARDVKGAEYVFAGNKLTMSKSGKEQKFTFKLDPSKKPKTMDLAPVENPNAAPALVIYDLDGDDLKLVLGRSDKRPAEFTDKGQPLVTLKRKK